MYYYDRDVSHDYHTTNDDLAKDEQHSKVFYLKSD